VAELLQCDDHDYSTTLGHLPEIAVSQGWGYARASVPAARLEAILAKHGIERIDLLSIDTEGTELDVCGSMDWDLHRPSVVVIEYLTFGRAPQETATCDYFARLPYRLVHRTPCNLIFTRSWLPPVVRRRLSVHALARSGQARR
jgi:hypothetical protein